MERPEYIRICIICTDNFKTEKRFKEKCDYCQHQTDLLMKQLK